MNASQERGERKGPPAWGGGGGWEVGGAGRTSTPSIAPAAPDRPLSRILARLEELGCRPVGRNGTWMAFCPGHEDGRRRGLSIKELEDGRVLLFCHHGRPTEELLAAMGLEWHDLFPNGHRGNGRPREREARSGDPLAWWADRCGVPLEWLRKLPIEAGDGHVRFLWPGLPIAKARAPGAKGFWQVRDGATWRVKRAEDDVALPGLWPALPERAPPVLMLCEGESDALCASYVLETAGLEGVAFATGVTMGARQQPGPALLRELLGRGVKSLLLVPDTDEEGERWAQAWAAAARAAGLAVAVLRLQEQGLVSPSLGEKDLRDAFRRQAVRLGAVVKEVVEGLAEGAGAPAHSFLPSIEGERGRNETAAWQPVPIGEGGEGPALKWVWEGFIARGLCSDLYGLWKAGKSTLLGCLLREMVMGGELAGRAVAQGRALVVSEESVAKWRRRADALGIPHGAHDVIARPFLKQPSWEEWEAFGAYLAGLVRERGYALVVLDALPNLWPVRKENEAGEVLQGLRPLVAVLEAGAAVLLVRHPRKSDGEEATAGRGSGAIAGFCDIIIEFRRYRPEDREDARRLFSVYSREEPFEVVADFDGRSYIALGAQADVRRGDRLEALLSVLPHEPPGLTAEEVRERWPVQPRPAPNTIRDDLLYLLGQGRVVRTGEGRKGDPHRWHRPGAGPGPADSFPPRSPSLGGRNEMPTAEGERTAFEAEGASDLLVPDDGPSPPSQQAPPWAAQVLAEALAAEGAFDRSPAEPHDPPFEAEEGPPHPRSGCRLCRPAPWPWWSMGYRVCYGADGPVLLRAIADPGRHLLQHALDEPAVAVSEELLKEVHPAWLIVDVKGLGRGWLDLQERPGQEVDFGEPQRAWKLSQFTWEGRQLPMQWGAEFSDTGGEFPDTEFPDGISGRPTPQEFPNRGAEFPNAGKGFPNGVSERPGGVSERPGVSEHRVSEQVVSEQPGGVSEQGRCQGCGRPLPRRPTGRPPRWCSDACRMRAARKGERP